MNCNVSFPTINYLSNFYSKELIKIARKFEENFNNIIDDEVINNIRNYSNKLVGFDIPILLHTKQCKTNKTIIILGESPLRHKSLTGTLIRTPFAIGSKTGLFGFKQCEKYNKIIQNILDLGYNVYVTDIIKIWTDEYIDKKKLKVSDEDIETFVAELDILRKCFEVNNIICWGNKSYTAINHLNEHIIHILHPSSMNVKNWKNKYNISGTDESIINKSTKLIINNII